MPDKIIISFDDEDEEAPVPAPAPEPAPEAAEPPSEENIIPLDSYPKGSRYLNKFYNSPLEFPSGIEKSFFLQNTVNLKDEFLNSILETSRHIVLSSVQGSIYFVNKNTLAVDERFNFKEQSFEKTGIVIQDTVYINSLDRIYKISGMNAEEIYSPEKGFYIWSDLNYDTKLIYIEYNPAAGKVMFHGVSGSVEIPVQSAPSGGIVVSDEGYAFTAGGELFIIGRDNEVRKFRINPQDECPLFWADGKIFFVQTGGEIYFLKDNAVRYSGIRNRFLNSAASAGKIIFTGNMNGWDAYTFTGNVIFSHSENSPCLVPAVSENIVCVCVDNDLLLHNMNNLSEAENIYIKSGSGIISVMISGNAIYALTKNGILALINNSKINIKI